jgi:hypothetical protein
MQSVHKKNIMSNDVMKKIMNNRHQFNKNKEYFKSFFSISQQKKNANQCFIKILN